MPTSSAFEARYASLNTSQKQAVDTIDGPVMVIAGPGTGKTTILTLRIANILLKTDTAPENILALTFTESGVYAMRKKLVALIGNAGYRVRIYTFHSFCNDIIQQYPEYFPRIIGGVSIEETEQISIIESIITKNTYTDLKPFGDPLYYVSHVLHTIRDLKREGISPDALREFIERQSRDIESNEEYYNKKTGALKSVYQTLDKKIRRTAEMCDVYAAYQAALLDKKKYDFEDMILEAVSALEQDNGLLQILQEEYQYLLADEHQDTNNAQNKILELLASFHDSPNLFIVGDEKQAIYRFQGASLENFLYFKGRFADAALITLETNYRSTQAILDSSHELISNNVVDDPMLRIPLVAGNRGAGVPIRTYPFSEERYEQQFIVQDIQKRVSEGTDPAEIAVLYRNNGDVKKILPYLEQTDIPFTVHADRSLLEERDAMRLILLLRAAAQPLDDAVFARVLHMDFLNVHPVDVHKIVRYAATNKKPIIDVLLDEQVVQNELDAKDAVLLLSVGKLFSNWIQRIRDEAPLPFFESLFKESGLLEHILSHDASYERLAVVDSLFREFQKVQTAKPFATIDDFLEHITLLETYAVRVPMRARGTKSGVALMTAHRSKGLEFEYVYIMGVTDKRWGGKQNRSYFVLPFDALSDTVRDADERRLFYVALTRAKHEAIISYAEQSIDGRALLPSQFISELKQELVSYEDTALIEAASPGLYGAYTLTPKPTAKSMHDTAYIQALFLEQSLSVTALNSYLNCPWQYFFMNLIRLPRTYNKHQQYGSAVHDALKKFFDLYATGESVPFKTLDTFFKESLEHYVADEVLREELYLKGTASLTAYYQTHKDSWPRELRTEFAVYGVEFSFKEANITLTGKLDKVEFIDGHVVNVVDYKTGKPKSRNALLGETKDSNGDYFRQLVFYKVLLDRFDNGAYAMRTGTIDFVEPEKDVCVREIFEITDKNTKELCTLIEETASDIYNLRFWDKRCDDATCEFCALRDMMPE